MTTVLVQTLSRAYPCISYDYYSLYLSLYYNRLTLVLSNRLQYIGFGVNLHGD